MCHLSRICSAAVFSLAILTLGACAADRGPDLGTWVAEWDTIGDTVVVRTISGSVWGEPRELVEDLSIGVLDGPEELMFGSIQRIAVDEAGGIYVFDSHVPALRYFDAEGNYVRTLGHEGGGPGEYGDFTGGMAIRHDGKIVLADFRNARLNLYEPDGRLAAHWSLQGGFFPRHPVVVDTADDTYVPILSELPANQPMKVGYMHLDAEGNTVDTMYIPSLPDEPALPTMGSAFAAQMLMTVRGPMDPSKEHALSPLGYLVVGVNDDYSFDLRWPDGRTVRIERAYQPVSYTAEERAEFEALFNWFAENDYPVDLGSVPERKLPYAYFRLGEEGRIWVRRHVEARRDELVEQPAAGSRQPPALSWVEREVYDVFEPDGTYLGEVWLPWRTRPLVIRGDTAWGVRRGELDEQYIVRLVLPGAARSDTD